MLDTRRHLRGFIDAAHRIPLSFVFISFLISLCLALAIAFIPEYALSDQGVYTLFILLFAAGLWVTEAIPAFAVSLLIIALEITLLGAEGFDFQNSDGAWKAYLEPWSSPLIFLFLAGFIMARAASKTKLDLWLAKRVLFFVGGKPRNIVIGLMGITFSLSMFVSNTATAAMMMTVLSPMLLMVRQDNPFKKTMLLAVVIGANLGGMATIIGTPPNAIAVGILGENAPSFVGWMGYALPPALATAALLGVVVLKLYPSTQGYISLRNLKSIEHFDDSTKDYSPIPKMPSWKKKAVIAVFAATIGLWLTGPLHHVPTTVVSLLPIVIFTMLGIIDADDIRSLRWDVIILIIGGLSLGMAVAKNGVDGWFAQMIPTQGLGLAWIILAFSYVVVVVSNFMSNTAATNIILPIAVAVGATLSQTQSQYTAIAVALSASFAMCLPVSTPPNAIVYSSRLLDAKNFLILGIIAGLAGPLLVFGWLYLLLFVTG